MLWRTGLARRRIGESWSARSGSRSSATELTMMAGIAFHCAAAHA
jgi:hypothetical protein